MQHDTVIYSCVLEIDSPFFDVACISSFLSSPSLSLPNLHSFLLDSISDEGIHISFELQLSLRHLHNNIYDMRNTSKSTHL